MQRTKSPSSTGPAALGALLLLVLLVAGIWLWRTSTTPPGGAPPAETPQPALDFKVVDANEQEVQLSDYRGKIVFINFWATWCGPCKQELPMLEAYYREHQDESFVLLGVNVSDRPEDALAFYEAEGYTFPLAFDPPGNVLIELGARGLPVSLLVDKEGHLVEQWIGALPPHVLEESVTPRLPGTSREADTNHTGSQLP